MKVRIQIPAWLNIYFAFLNRGKSHAPKPEPSAEMGDNLPDRMMY